MNFQQDSEDLLLSELDKLSVLKGDEWNFRNTALSIRSIKVQRQLNEQLVMQTRRLVYATWTLCIITIATIIIDKLAK
ncbi:MAG: hypothetical protein ACOY82_17395 [Pseudomonadota bacterium]